MILFLAELALINLLRSLNPGNHVRKGQGCKASANVENKKELTPEGSRSDSVSRERELRLQRYLCVQHVLSKRQSDVCRLLKVDVCERLVRYVRHEVYLVRLQRYVSLTHVREHREVNNAEDDEHRYFVLECGAKARFLRE